MIPHFTRGPCAALIISLTILFSAPVLAADRCVRTGGTGDGSDWSNALGQLPATLTRGDTYWVAAGTYAGYAFTTPAAGETPIIVKKATAQAHGPAAGWQPAYGEGVAVWGPMSCTASYVSFDGVTGEGKTGHGFEINGGKGGPELWAFDNAPTSVTIAHTNMHFDSRDVAPTDAIYGNTPCKNITVSHCYIHDISRCPLLMRYWTALHWDHNWAARNKSTPDSHAEGVSTHGGSDHVFRDSVWEDIEGTAVIVNLDAPTSNWVISGNVFFETGKAGGVGHGIVGDNFGNSGINGLKFFNNTAYNLSGISTGLRFWSPGSTNIVVRNNIWMGCREIGFNQATHDHNSYYDCTMSFEFPTGAGADELKTTGDPFVGAATGDFHLKAATAPGVSTGQDAAVDPEGIARGSDGTWDRGAFEFGGTAATPGSSSANTSATASASGTADGAVAGDASASAVGSYKTLIRPAAEPAQQTPSIQTPAASPQIPEATGAAAVSGAGAEGTSALPVASALPAAAPAPTPAASQSKWVYIPGPSAAPMMPAPAAIPQAAATNTPALPASATAAPGELATNGGVPGEQTAPAGGNGAVSAPPANASKMGSSAGGSHSAKGSTASTQADSPAKPQAGATAGLTPGVVGGGIAPGGTIKSGFISIGVAPAARTSAPDARANSGEPLRLVITNKSSQVITSGTVMDAPKSPAPDADEAADAPPTTTTLANPEPHPMP